MARTRRRRVYLAAEGTYETDPSASGSGYLWVPATSVGELVDKHGLEETNYNTGRNWGTRFEPLVDGAELELEVPMIGLATAANDGVAPPANDWLDLFLTHIFGTQASLTGDGAGSGSTTTNLVTDGQVAYATQDLLAVFQGGLAVNRTQWVVVTSAASPNFGVAPTMEQAVTTAGVAFGSKIYRPDSDGGATIACVYVDDDLTYTLLGGRVTSFSIKGDTNRAIRAKLGIRFSTKTLDGSKSSLPNVGAGPAVTALKCFGSPVYFNNVNYATAGWELDFGLETAVVPATSGGNGRAGDELITLAPVLTIHPLRTDAIVNLKRGSGGDPTVGRMMLQLGAGRFSTVLNSMAVHFEAAQVIEVSGENENGRPRHAVQIKAIDNGQFSAGVDAHLVQVARA